mmetsp:Transcript_10092/g.15470  ORF Transcript_10092/g.15470 Transcript_10092/m.15470 type:complete len:98 (+) Transcript_10092:1293-1586(+)
MLWVALSNSSSVHIFISLNFGVSESRDILKSFHPSSRRSSADEKVGSITSGTVQASYVQSSAKNRHKCIAFVPFHAYAFHEFTNSRPSAYIPTKLTN